MVEAGDSVIEGDKAAPTPYRLAKVAGIFAIVASTVAGEYGTGINFVLPNSLGTYPAVEWLVPFAMLVAGFVLLPKIALFARFSAVGPRAGSTYVWLTRTVNLPIGFVVSFLWVVGMTAAIGLVAYSSALYISAFLSSIGLPAAWVVSPGGHLAIGVALIWLGFTVHYFGVRNYLTLVSIAFVLIILTVAMTLAYGFSTSHEMFLSKVAAYATVTPPTLTTPSLSSFISVIMLFMFAYGGVTAAVSLGGETRDATRSMPRGLIIGFLTTVTLYTTTAFALFHAVPWWSVSALIASKHQSLVTTPGLIGLVAPRAVSATINLLVALIAIKTVGPQLMDCSRLLFAWGQDGLLPKAFEKTSPSKAPYVALLVTAVVATFFLIETIFMGWTIGVTLRSASLVLVFGMLGVGVFNMRFGTAKSSPLIAESTCRRGALTWAGLAILVATILLSSVIVLPKLSWWLQPTFQGFIAALIAICVYLSARLRDSTIAQRCAQSLPLE